MEVKANQSIPLDEAWFIDKGHVNLFAVKKIDGEPRGARTLIAHLTAPALLCPIEGGEDYEIAAFTETPCALYPTSLSSVDPVQVRDWINALALFYGGEDAPDLFKRLAPAGEVDLENGTGLAALEDKREVAWVEVMAGELEWLGKTELILKAGEGPFPLTHAAWTRAKGHVRLTSNVRPEGWQAGLARFHQLFYDYFLIRQAEEAAFEREIADTRRLHEEKSVHDSLAQMAAVLNPVKVTELAEGVDPLFRACEIVGEAMGIEFQVPRELQSQADVSSEIKVICQASEVRYRQVRLMKRWWTKDSGPLLGFYGEEARPVALIAKRPGHYDMVDVDTRQRTKVNAEVATNLVATAYCFYRPFPDDLTTGKGVARFFFHHNAREFPALFIYGVLAAIIALFPPLATNILFGRVIPEANKLLFLQVTIGLLLAATSTSLFLFFRFLAAVRIEGRFSDQTQAAIWDRLLKLPTKFFRRFSTGNLITRIISVEQIRMLLSGQATRALFSGIFACFYLIAMLIYAPTLSLIALGLVLFVLLLTGVIAYFYTRMEKEIYEINGRINAFLVQVITAVGKLRTAGAEKNAFSEWAFDFARSTKLQLRAKNVKSVLTVANYLLPFALYLLIFAFVMRHNADYSIGRFLAFNIALIPFYVAITNLSNTLLELIPVLPLWQRSQVIIQEPQEERVKDNRPGRLSGEISVDEVFFKYEGSQAQVLDNLTLKIHSKEFVAIVGPSGCGKSTLVRMLLGFEQPHSGGVFYDGENLAGLAVTDVRRQLGVVLQDEGIVAGSIYDNLVCGGIYPPSQVERALDTSGFAADLATFPMGINTYLPMGGTTLSGGQKQRLLIARALLPNPRILIFDEATNALDNQNQKKVTDALDALDVTRIVIAHRLSTIRNADRIYVMQAGCITQTGTFDELASEPGLFASMLDRQTH